MWSQERMNIDKGMRVRKASGYNEEWQLCPYATAAFGTAAGPQLL